METTIFLPWPECKSVLLVFYPWHLRHFGDDKLIWLSLWWGRLVVKRQLPPILTRLSPKHWLFSHHKWGWGWRKNKEVTDCWGFILRSRRPQTQFDQKGKKKDILLHLSLPELNQILLLNGEQRGCQKSDPGQDHHYAGCLGQTHVSLPEELIGDHCTQQWKSISPTPMKENCWVSGRPPLSRGEYPHWHT